jgi:hypothetical protein
MPGVRLELPVQAVELDIGEVVGLDGDREVRVEALQLDHDRLGLRALRLNVGVSGCRSRAKQERSGESREEDDSRRPSGCRAPNSAPASTPDRPAGGGLARHKSRSLAPFPDTCNRKPPPKSLQSDTFIRQGLAGLC